MEADDRDTGLECLTLMLRFHQVAVDPAHIKHQFAGARIGTAEMIRCAKQLKLKARATRETWKGLAKMPLPAVVVRADGTFVILGQVTTDAALIQDPILGRPQNVPRAEFEANWTGAIVLLARRASLSDLARRFDITWFLQAMHKYRRLLAEALLASFFLHLFGLVTPLFFQVVTDKVLAHRGYTTLDVLVFGLIVVSIFETVLGALRTYVFSHTTNRIDVELGARLFRHLIALPIAYFEARRGRRLRGAGARAREHPQLPDQLGPDARNRSRLHLRVAGRDVLLFAVPQLDRGRLVSVLYRDLRGRDADLPRAAGQEVRPRRGEPGLPG